VKAKSVFVALDGLSDRQALRLVDRLGEDAPFYKIGLELFTLYGPRIARLLLDRGKGVFLDLKYHDIPETVARAVGAASSLEPRFLTIHATGGEEMLRAAVRGRGECSTRLLAVTVLTSARGRGVAGRVLGLAGEAREAGCDGVVASAREAARIKQAYGKEFLVVVPGIRPRGFPRDDQARVATPGEAGEAGADFLVVGRPITRAPDPAAVLADIEREFRDARR
jgi:orotidine-5'-phosphate decarboxylase